MLLVSIAMVGLALPLGASMVLAAHVDPTVVDKVSVEGSPFAAAVDPATGKVYVISPSVGIVSVD